ncbi:MAG: FMN-binding protein [Eubacterium sp.]|nr:FMN-binding protein [Eubacterium sp.]
MVFSAVRDLLAAFMDGSFSAGELFPQMTLVFMVFLVTALWGRFFCGFLCSFGMLQELIFFFSKRVISGKVRIPERFDSVMKFLKYVILVFIVAGVWILALPVDSSWNPWGVFGILVSGNFSIISSAIPTVGFVALLAIMAASVFVGRFFCRYLCPLGALLAVVSGKRLYKIRRQSDSCTNCGLCTRSCSMGIRIPEKNAVISGECIQCMQCLSTCPKESLSASPAGAIAGAAAAAAIGGTVIVGNLTSFPVTETISDQQVTEKKEKGNYKDGVYTGVGEGFRGTTEVQVTVEDGYIADITVLSFRDDQEFFHKAQSAVIKAILTEQTTDVSAVSGATFSSNSIMDAVADALGSSVGSSGQPVDESNPSDSSVEAGENQEQTDSDASQLSGDNESEPSDSGQESDSASGQFSVADGVYEGTGNGFRGATNVSVTVENGTITDITINSYADDAAYFTRAQDTVISEIISAQSLDVQAVSGATFSSNSIMDAVADALGVRSDRSKQPAGGESGSGAEGPGAGGGNGPGFGQHGAGGHGGGWRGGSGRGGHGGR